MTRTLTGLAAVAAMLTAFPGSSAKADPITGWIIAGVAVNTLLKAPFYEGRADYGPRYGYPLYGYPGYLRPGYRYAAYAGPGEWIPPDPEAAPVRPTTCYWTNRPEPQGMRRVRICY